MIKIFPDQTTSREQPPRFLKGLASESLLDLSWTDPQLGVQDCAWWPEVDVSETIDINTHKLDGTESFEIDTENMVVRVTRGYRLLTDEELSVMVADKKEIIQTQINALFKSETATLKGNVQQEEVDTFDSQKEEAIAYQADNTAETPLLTGLAAVRGLTVAELSVRVLAHATAYKTAMGVIMGKKHSLEDQLAAAETMEDLEGIEVA